MRTEIIEILQKKYPEYCMQHIDTADEILRLFSVVWQSEQLKALCDYINPLLEPNVEPFTPNDIKDVIKSL